MGDTIPSGAQGGKLSRILLLVRKVSGGWRPVIDFKHLNAHLNAPHFRMFTISSVLSTIKNGDYVLKIDLKDVNFHVPVHRDRRNCLRFIYLSNVRVLPSGMSTAPSYLLVSGTLKRVTSMVRGYQYFHISMTG